MALVPSNWPYAERQMRVTVHRLRRSDTPMGTCIGSEMATAMTCNRQLFSLQIRQLLVMIF
jgi:hypothetical protein